MEPKNRPAPNLAAWAGLALAAVMALGFVLDLAIMSTTGDVPVLRLDSLGADLTRAAGSALWPVEAWVYALMGLPALALVPALHRRLASRADGGVADMGLAALVSFWAVHTVHNVVMLGVVTGLAPAYHAGAADAPAVEASARGLVAIGQSLFGPGSGLGAPLMVLAGLAYGLRMRAAGGFPTWAGAAALGSALFTAVGFFQFAAPALLAAGLIGWVLFIVWTAGAGVGLLREEGTPAPAAPAAEAA